MALCVRTCMFLPYQIQACFFTCNSRLRHSFHPLQAVQAASARCTKAGASTAPEEAGGLVVAVLGASDSAELKHLGVWQVRRGAGCWL